MGQPKPFSGAMTSWKPNANVSVPTKVKCCRCSKVKNPPAFAKNRLEDLKNEIARKGSAYNASISAYISCMECTGGQVTELFCNGCDKWKGLNSFAKAQRRTPDNAKCWPCMQEQLNTEPGASSDDSSGNSGNDSDSDESVTGGTTLGGMSNLTITNGATSETGGVALASPAPTKASTTTPPHLRKALPSVTSGNSGGFWKAPRSVNSGNSNFAKVRAVKRPVDMDAARFERGREREQEPDEDVEAATSESDDSD